MTVQSAASRNDYEGNGLTVDFPVTFRFLNKTHLRVFRTVIATNVTTELTLDSLGADGFSVTGVGQPTGGSVHVVTAPSALERLSILRNMPFTQLIDYIANDPFPAESHERGLDERAMENQQLREVTDRAIVLSPQTTGVSTELPGPVALNLLRWKADLTGLENAVPPALATVADGSVVDATVSPIAGIQSSKLSFTQQGAGAIPRTVQDKLRERRTPDDYGAAGDGVTDDRAEVALADAAGPFLFVSGKTYRIASNITISRDVAFEPGAKLSIDAGVIVTFTGAITAGPHQIFAGSGTANGFSKNWTLLPEWFGADPLTVADSTAAVQKTLTAAVGREVELSGLYLVSSAVVISLPVLLRGKSKTNSGFKTTNATANIIEVQCGAGPLTGVEIRDLYLDATGAKTAGYGIAILASSGGTLFDGVIDNVSMSDRMFSGLRVQSAFFLRLNDINVVKVGTNGIGFHFMGVDAISRVVNVYANKCIVRSGTAGGNTIGWLIDSYSEGFYCEACSMESAGLNYGVYIANSLAAPRPPENLWFSKVVCDNNATHGWNILAGLTVRLTDCWSTSCAADGVHITSVVDIEIKGHSSISNGNYGLFLQGGTQTRVIGGVFDANGQAAVNTYAGIVVSANVTDFTIVDAEFFRTGTTKSHAYDIQILAGTSDRYIVKNNRCVGYLTAGLQDGGTGLNKFVNENIT